ncbi:MAG: hypothetical protein R2991_10745 [Thermoanaerobaculia bacterium]
MLQRLLDPRVSLACLALWLPLAACGTAASDQGAPADATARTDGSDAEPSLFARIFRNEPEPVTVPAGTVVPVRFLDTLSSHESTAGQSFQAEVVQDVAIGERTVIPAGARVSGSVTEASPPKIGGRARLSLDFHTLEIDGRSYPIAAAFAQRGKSETPKDAAIIGGSTLGGAILGDAVDNTGGGGIGAVLGGIAGAIGAHETKGKPVVIPSGSTMSLQLASPITVEVS